MSIAEELTKLNELKIQGLLTVQEFETQKARLLAQPSPNATSPAPFGSQVPMHMPPRTDPALAMVLPIGRTGLSIAAGYLGLLSIIPLMGLLALAVGILAINDLKKKPEALGMGRAVFGVAMGTVFTVLYLWAFIRAGFFG